MTIVTLRIRDPIISQVAKLADEFKVPQSHIWRGMIETGAEILKQEVPPRLQRYYETINTQIKVSTIKEQTRLLASNAFFIKRSAKMLFEVGRVNQKLAEEMHELFLEEAEIRGVRNDFVTKIRGEIALTENTDKWSKELDSKKTIC